MRPNASWSSASVSDRTVSATPGRYPASNDVITTEGRGFALHYHPRPDTSRERDGE